MPELRQNIITRDWVIIASERARRPDQFAAPKSAPEPKPEFDSECPFCPGNEVHCTPAVLTRGKDGEWFTRVVPNKYPALHSSGERQHTVNGIYRSMNAVGYHDVVIEHRRHDVAVTCYTDEEFTRVLDVYLERFNQIKRDPKVESIVIFRNHGHGAGTSLQHPHSQIVATPLVPFQLRNRIDVAMNFYDDNGECIFCRTLQDELHSGERIIFETTHFAAFIPYAALSPFHIWIFPKRHTASFNEITPEETRDLAINLRTVLQKLHNGLNNPDFNFTIRSKPVKEAHSEYYHWYLAIVPRISVSAGFELGSGMFISTAIPEESAAFLREM